MPKARTEDSFHYVSCTRPYIYDRNSTPCCTLQNTWAEQWNNQHRPCTWLHRTDKRVEHNTCGKGLNDTALCKHAQDCCNRASYHILLHKAWSFSVNTKFQSLPSSFHTDKKTKCAWNKHRVPRDKACRKRGHNPRSWTRKHDYRTVFRPENQIKTKSSSYQLTYPSDPQRTIFFSDPHQQLDESIREQLGQGPTNDTMFFNTNDETKSSSRTGMTKQRAFMLAKLQLTITNLSASMRLPKMINFQFPTQIRLSTKTKIFCRHNTLTPAFRTRK